MNAKVSAILFDADGVLLDTCELHYVSLNAALAQFGYHITRDEHVCHYNALPTRVKLDLLSKQKGLDPALHQEILILKQQITLKRIRDYIAVDIEKVNMMRMLRDAGLKTAVCSNAVVESVAAMLEAVGVLRYVDVYFGNDQGFAPKPAPDMYLAAADALNVPIRNCAIVEDSPVGIAAATATGCPTIYRVESSKEVNLDLFQSCIPAGMLLRSA
jgi:HAD superfamily hydrolase (TIGR01509 family)